MTVRALLKDKGEQVSTIRPDVKVGEIMDQLERDEVSALVVSKDGRTILGIVSGGDVMRGLKRDGPAIVEKTVEEVMTSEVVTCKVGEPLATVYELMDANRIRHVPIVDNGDLCDLINTLDVVKHRLGELELEAEALKGYVADGREMIEMQDRPHVALAPGSRRTTIPATNSDAAGRRSDVEIDPIDMTLAETFPASDPPPWWAGPTDPR